MRKMLSIPILLLTLLGVSACQTQRVIAVPACAKSAPLTPELTIQGPDPLWFPQCWEESKTWTRGPQLPPSCERLQGWLSLSENGKTGELVAAPAQ